MLNCLIQGLGWLLCLFMGSRVINRARRWRRRHATIAFFHPYCNSLGGGERVLWSALAAMQTRYTECDFAIYTGDSVSDADILNRVKERFGLDINGENVNFVRLKCRCLIEARLYPVCTIFGQSVGGLVLGMEALFRLCPDVFLDTTGVSFTLPLFRLIGACQTGAYIHYPTISTDMLDMVKRRESSYNNGSCVAGSLWTSRLKLCYYRVFACIYSMAGLACQLVMVNSSWTYAHIHKLWKCTPAKVAVYPPCDVASFLKLQNEAEDILEQDKIVKILSVGQFRPEKDHRKQLRCVKMLKDYLKRDASQLKIELVLIGGCRNSEDRGRVDALVEYAAELAVDDCVTWALNANFEQLLNHSQQAMIYIHTMRNEHFGIGVVEGQASGCIVVAHNSGGPRQDIVVPVDEQAVGFLATTDTQYANEMYNIIVNMDRQQRQDIRDAARQSCAYFSEHSFAESWIHAIDSLLIPDT